ncbi:putative acetyl-CoA acyltransferase [Caenibius tardaugens NBRC 16725]|uniref:propanoyl-CoA C-acyltransferase n=1 Tax=Caenibius tardaugens NBRC 16725 TaxID=1219035 RepID=U2YLJ2_9SPHN|nr:acetyl-CoA acyltransferase [Caenibius tardaugens]GAD49267.1 putative acetyl-CoA acyltransferase [Caenibius tardaugens NBRC 16725]
MPPVVVAGTGMTPFVTPANSPDYVAMAGAAIAEALADAGVGYDSIDQAFAGYVYGDSTSGQAALYPSGLTGIPIFNVNNNCATGSSALALARTAIMSGDAECVLAIGFEQMRRGALAAQWGDRTDPLAGFLDVIDARFGPSEAPMAIRLFGGAGLDYQRRYGAQDSTFAMISVKARRHAAENPLAVFRDPLTVEQVLASQPLYGPLTRLQCCPPTCGAAAVVLCSERFAKAHGVDQSVIVASQAVTTDRQSSFDGADLGATVGAEMSHRAASAVYAAAGVDPADLDVVELHDCFTANELLSYEALALTPPGTAEAFILDGDNSYGGRIVVNPSGGLLAKGHPLGATGLAQAHELVGQLRGRAGRRQVEGARLALAHNIGLGGACVVTLYENRDGAVR